jgi:hypothetical protein
LRNFVDPTSALGMLNVFVAKKRKGVGGEAEAKVREPVVKWLSPTTMYLPAELYRLPNIATLHYLRYNAKISTSNLFLILSNG